MSESIKPRDLARYYRLNASVARHFGEAAVLRKTLLNLHLYGGVLCFSYLILFGISSLDFNHSIVFTKWGGSVTTWTQPMPVVEDGEESSLGRPLPCRKLRLRRRDDALLRLRDVRPHRQWAAFTTTWAFMSMSSCGSHTYL